MLKIKPTFRLVLALGYLACGLSIINTLVDEFYRDIHPYSPGVGLADGAFGLIGVIAIIVAACLKHYEARITRLERDKS
jgi:hypothetical protein